jgi:hypothetical protein
LGTLKDVTDYQEREKIAFKSLAGVKRTLEPTETEIYLRERYLNYDYMMDYDEGGIWCIALGD